MRERAHQTNAPMIQPGFQCEKTKWYVISKVRSGMPKSPEQYATVVQGLKQGRTSPAKRRALHTQSGLKKTDAEGGVGHVMKHALDEMRKTKGCNGKSALKALAFHCKKVASQRLTAKMLKLHRQSVKIATKPRKLRKDKIKGKKIFDFYKREDISRCMPGKRHCTKFGPGFFMQVTVKAAFTKFGKENQNSNICFSKFASMQPKNVKLIQSNQREYCLCVYCLNVKFDVLALHRAALKEGIVDTPKDEGELMDMILCPKGEK